MGNVVDRINSVADARYFARKRTPKSIFQMFDGGSAPSNEKAFEDIRFGPSARNGKCTRKIALSP